MKLKIISEMAMKRATDLKSAVTIEVHGDMVDVSCGDGHISMAKCEDVPLKLWSVRHSGATKGYGPLLYDVAMEWATINGDGLISDYAGTTSNEAMRVWVFYKERRPDVTATPIPPQVIDKLADDQFDRSGYRIALEGPCAYRYTKKPEKMNELNRMGLLELV